MLWCVLKYKNDNIWALNQGASFFWSFWGSSFVLRKYFMSEMSISWETSESMNHQLNSRNNFVGLKWNLNSQMTTWTHSLNTLKKPDCRHNSVKTLVIYGKAQGSATPFCVTDAVKWARDLRNRICCPVVFALNTKQACGGTIPKRAPFNQSKTSKYK